MKRFEKDNKKVILGIISLVLVGIITCVAIYKSHAYFETSKTYNVLKGRIPNFSGGDITLAVKVDGEKRDEFPEKGDYIVWSDCSNGMSVDWDYDAWKAKINNDITKPFACNMNFKSYDKFINTITYNGEKVDKYPDKGNLSVTVSCNNIDGKWDYNTWKPILNGANKDTTCDAKFENIKLNFGDGSLNTVENGYNDKVVFYDTLNQKEIGNKYKYPGFDYSEYNCNNSLFGIEGNILHNPPQDKKHNYLNIIAGENEITIPEQIGSNNIISLFFNGIGAGFGEISNLEIYLDGKYYTLKSAVENKKIKPIVLMYASSYNTNSPKINVLSLYDKGTASIKTHGCVYIYFMLEDNVKFSKLKVNSSGFSTTYDGLAAYRYDNVIMYLK